MELKINIKKIFNFMLLFYFVTLTSFQSGYGISPIIKKVSIALLILTFLICYKKIRLKSITKYLIVFWLFYLLSFLWAKNASNVYEYLNVSIYMIIVSVILSNYIKDSNDIIYVLKLILYSLIISIVILIFKTPLSYFGTSRIGDSLGLHPNALGARMAYGSIISIFLFNNDSNNNKKKKILYILYMIIFIAFVVLSGSKLAIFISVFSILLYETITTKGFKFLLKIGILGVLIYLLYYFIMNNAMLYKVIGNRIESFFLSLNGVSSKVTGDVSTYERKFYIAKAIELFKSYPIIGYGGNNFKTYIGELDYSHAAYSHNNFLELLSTLGIFGFIIYYLPWVNNFKKNYNLKVKKSNKNYNLKYFFLIFVLVKTMADYATISYINEFINILFILSFTYIYVLKKEGSEIEDEQC